MGGSNVTPSSLPPPRVPRYARDDRRTSMRENLRRFLADAADDIVDRVAAEEEGEGGAPDAGEFGRGRFHEWQSPPFDEERRARCLSDHASRNIELLRLCKHRAGVVGRDECTALRFAEEKRDRVEIVSDAVEIDVAA